jgi:hypothetical protein
MRNVRYIIALVALLAVGCATIYTLPDGQKVPARALRTIGRYENERRASAADSSFKESQAQRNREGRSGDSVADQIAARNRDSRYEGRSQTYHETRTYTDGNPTERVQREMDSTQAEIEFHENPANVGKQCPYGNHKVK